MDMPEGHTAHESSSGRKRFTYQGRKVLLHDPGGDATPMMTIDGTDVMIRREEGGGYSAPMLNMHEVYESLEELAQGLIDTSPVFLATKRGRPSKKGGR